MLVVSKSENETISQIINFFSKNKIPSLILLEGDVGTGKTIIVKAIAEYLNIEDNITSPSFGIKKTYNGLIHYDLYFKNNNLSKEFYTLINEDLEDNVVVIEWPEHLNLKKIDNYLYIKIGFNNKITNYNERLIKFEDFK